MLQHAPVLESTSGSSSTTSTESGPMNWSLTGSGTSAAAGSASIDAICRGQPGHRRQAHRLNTKERSLFREAVCHLTKSRSRRAA
jgi:hypothetical protein